MAELKRTEEMAAVEAGLDRKVERLDEDLKIMERHAEELADAEEELREAMRRWDREYKDARFHSVPKPRKHIR